MFRNARKDDLVWSLRSGWGVITEIETPSITKYPISVTFDNDDMETFTLDGKYKENDINPILFWDEVCFKIPKKPKKRIKAYVFYKEENGSFVHGSVFYRTRKEAMSNFTKYGKDWRVAEYFVSEDFQFNS